MKTNAKKEIELAILAGAMALVLVLTGCGSALENAKDDADKYIGAVDLKAYTTEDQKGIKSLQSDTRKAVDKAKDEKRLHKKRDGIAPSQKMLLKSYILYLYC
ncbi:hypothetical protein [Mobilibacterium timonense]|jgi:hypothetical protein|uniref:hypothetical protein n=1 Tax=Mobilibacterium timonense TaxID=1871012 RepID=UPI000984FDD3|nr:hypothetical protein [Mobilibacterium timonense]MBM6990115.1 hypothetical protein [Mobilibacterium timonense]